MLKFYECVEKLKEFLKKEEEIIAFKIIINTDTTLSVRLICNNGSLVKKIENFCNIKVYVEEIYTDEEYKEDEFLQNSLDNEIDWSYKKRFDSFNYKEKIKFDIPIVSFYSYKGGVGRTTSLIAFASYYSNIKEKNVAIIDFDFEAPGIINFFDIDFEKNPKNGVIEYLLDTQTSKQSLDFKNYHIEVSKKFSGAGNIYAIPAGNIFNIENIKSYLEGLSRIDINSAEAILKKLKELLDTIKKELNPDIILIDSRTGFNDIFGLLSHSISSMIVGFFTNNKQNTPGLEMFLDLMDKKDSPNSILVHSQIHFDRGYKKRFEVFKEKINKIMQSENIGNITYTEKIPLLIEIGSEDEDTEEFIDFIKNRYKLTSYKELFNLIIDNLDETSQDNIKLNKLDNNTNPNIIDLKSNLLHKLQDKYPNLYAEDNEKIINNQNFIKNDFYIRTCMEDIFNFDKFLLIGGKGSGKTAFYNALKSDIFTNFLLKKANKATKKFIFVDVVSLKSDRAKNKFFPINLLKDYTNKDYRFYKRFWQIYIINSLALEQNKIKLNTNKFKFKFEPMAFNDKQTTKIEEFFNKYIEKEFEVIENEFIELDNFLKKWDINLIVTLDQLDFIVKPNFWNNAIVPLIDMTKGNSYFKIYPKLFIRRDLFEKLSNYTNKESLRDTNSINLEWNKDEIFGFFFKIIFAYAKDEFFKIMAIYNGENKKFISPIQKEINKQNNQIPLEKYYLDPLIETFFGKYAYDGFDENKKKKFGYMYDWFYNNLKNADNTISLRPFLALIKEAISKYLQINQLKNIEKPILPAKFHTNNEVRKLAVKGHFNDLAGESGNEDFKIIIEHMRDTASSFPRKYRKRILVGKTYEDFLQYLFDKLELEANNINDIEKILIINGVIKVDFLKSNLKKAEFAYLYKYYLGLSG